MTHPYPLTIVEEHTEPTDLEPLIENLHEAISVKAEELHVPPIDLTVVLSGDLAASVIKRGETDFQPERLLGAVVRGKTLPRDWEHTAVDLVLDASLIHDRSAYELFSFIFVLVHEYAHALIGRLRAADRPRPEPLTRAQSPAEAGAALAIVAADEYRADLFANDILRSVTYSVDGGEQQPVTLDTVHGDIYRTHFGKALDEIVYPGWPDVVEAYRHYEITLEELQATLFRQSEEVVTLLAHAEACEQASGRLPVLTNLSAHPGVRLYLADAWTPIRRLLDGAVIPAADAFAAADRAIRAAGDGFVDMWAKLGVTGEITPDGGLYLHVTDPVR